MKTICIVVSEALLVRNILRAGTFSFLKNAGHKLVVFIVCNSIPEDLQKECEGENVELIAINRGLVSEHKLHKAFILFTHFLIYNATTKIYFRYSRHYLHRSWFIHAWYRFLLVLFGHTPGLKWVTRFVEKTCFPEKHTLVQSYFDMYKPDLVFSTSITSRYDNVFLKEAKRRGIVTVSMTKSWDNATKMYHRYIPDYFLVQNEIIKEKLIELQDVPRDRIIVVGFAQFDWYADRKNILPRDVYLKHKGLNPELPVIFFGSQGEWYPYDYQVAECIYNWVKNNELEKPCQMIIRPHFSTVKHTKLKKLKGLPGVYYDDNYHVSNNYSDHWDPHVDEVIDFANTIAHSDMVVNMVSTLALDSACFDTPIINVLFGGTYRKGKDVTKYLSQVVHYRWVFDTGATTVVRNKEQLKAAINMYLHDRTKHSHERARLVSSLCDRVDGNASRRIFDALTTILKKHS